MWLILTSYSPNHAHRGPGTILHHFGSDKQRVDSGTHQMRTAECFWFFQISKRRATFVEFFFTKKPSGGQKLNWFHWSVSCLLIWFKEQFGKSEICVSPFTRLFFESLLRYQWVDSVFAAFRRWLDWISTRIVWKVQDRSPPVCVNRKFSFEFQKLRLVPFLLFALSCSFENKQT